jgi:hypothetical protein
MNANVPDAWERPNWNLAAALATLIIFVSLWIASEKTVTAYEALLSKPVRK